MSQDWKKLLHPDPEKAWREAGKAAKPIIDPIIAAKDRIGKGITDTIEVMKAGVDAPARGWYKIKHDVAKVSVKVGNKILPIEGNAHNTVKRDQAHHFYDGILASIKAGHFDDQIRALIAGDKSKTPAKRNDAGKPRAPWTPERRAAHEAKQAAKKKSVKK